MSSLKSQFLILRPPSSGFHPLRLMGQSLRINPEGSNASKPTLRVLAELACSSPAPHPSLTSVQNKNSARVWGTPRRWVTPAPAATAPVRSFTAFQEMQSMQSHIKQQLQPLKVGDCENVSPTEPPSLLFILCPLPFT